MDTGKMTTAVTGWDRHAVGMPLTVADERASAPTLRSGAGARPQRRIAPRSGEPVTRRGRSLLLALVAVTALPTVATVPSMATAAEAPTQPPASTRSAAAPVGTSGAAAAARRTPPTWPARGAAAPAVPRLAWKRCLESKNTRLRCATALVPLDYRNPRGAQIRLDLVKLPATKPRQRLGSLFVNPGGPGNPASASLRRFSETLGTPVTDRFDLVAMDPRGVGESSVARCWSTRREPPMDDSYPVTAKEVAQRLLHNRYEATNCAATGHPIIDHMSTGNVARDMDLIRAAVGDRRLTYYGISYGTMLGQTYAALFPSRVRAVALDGVVDPVSWTTGYGRQWQRVPSSARTNAGLAADESLRSVFAACATAGPKRCPHGAAIAAEWRVLIKRLSAGPVTVGGETYRLADQISGTMSMLYDPADQRANLDQIHAAYLAVVKKKPQAAARPRAAATPHLGVLAVPRPVPPTRPQPNAAVWWDTFRREGVLCADGVNPKDPQVWPRYAAAASRSSWFTPAWAWQSALCATWPGKDPAAYQGPFTVRPARPLLVIGNTHDPATPLSSARTAAKLSPGARLVTLDAFGHTAGDQSRCATAHLQRYLLTGAPPARSVTCRADKPLF